MTASKYLFSSPEGTVPVPEELWDRPLPNSNPNQCQLTLRDYFELLDQFLQKRKKSLLVLYKRENGWVRIEDFQHLEIISERLGTFYQIARCIFRNGNNKITFCVSTSTSGQDVLIADFCNLCFLRKKLGVTFVPQPFILEPLFNASSSEKPVMMAAVTQWLDNYWEWHLLDRTHACLWIPGRGEVQMSREECLDLFRGIGLCLALSLHPEKMCHIWLWSNCAGDFVASPHHQAQEVSVMLTTVRYYGSPWQGILPADSHDRFMALILYHFLDTALTVRIDRRSGTGAYLFASRGLLKASVQGYIDGLKRLEQVGRLQKDGAEEFMDLMLSLDYADLLTLYSSIISSHESFGRDDAEVMKNSLADHCHELMDVVSDLHVAHAPLSGALGQAAHPCV